MLQCYRCHAILEDDPACSGRVTRCLCPPCHAIVVAEMDAKNDQPVGGESCPPEYEDYVPCHTPKDTGKYSGQGMTSGGGERVIKKPEGMGG